MCQRQYLTGERKGRTRSVRSTSHWCHPRKFNNLLLWGLVGLSLIKSTIEKSTKHEGRWCCYFSKWPLLSMCISVFQMYTRMNCNFRQAIDSFIFHPVHHWMKYKIRVKISQSPAWSWPVWPSQLCWLFMNMQWIFMSWRYFSPDNWRSISLNSFCVSVSLIFFFLAWGREEINLNICIKVNKS